MNPKDIENKIKKYELFVEENLKKDLKDIEKILSDKSRKYEEWEDVKQVVKTLREFKEKDRDMKIRVDVGCETFVSGEVTDFDTTYIDIGKGYLLQMDCDEADKYSDIRMRLLKKEIDHFRKMVVDVKVHIKLVLLAINELQSSLLPAKLEKTKLT